MMKMKIEDLEGKDIEDIIELLPPAMISHSRRVAVCSAIMTEQAGNLMNLYGFKSSDELATAAHLGGTCHDIGKLLIPEPDQDNNHEYLLHPEHGVNILMQGSNEIFSSTAQKQIVLDMVSCHHERPDGAGYPIGLTCRDIPLAAAICAVADCLDNLMFANEAEQIDLATAFQYMTRQVNVRFTATAQICLEKSIMRLAEMYAKWKAS